MNPFNTTTTGTSYYDNFLNDKDLKYMQDAKNLTGEVVMMTPEEYYQECADNIFKNTTANKLLNQRTNSFSDQYIKDMKKGDKFPLPYLNYSEGHETQEGLHRMKAAGDAFGWDTKFPVLIVKDFDEVRAAQTRFLREINDFKRYYLENAISDTGYELADWSSPIPENVEEVIANHVQDKAKKETGHDIIVEVEIEEIDGGHKVNVYLTSYDGYELDFVENSAERLWLEDIYDTNPDSDEVSDDDDDNIDDELDIEDLLFI